MEGHLKDILNAQRIANAKMQTQLAAMTEAMTHDRQVAQQGLATSASGVQPQHQKMQQAVADLTASRQRDDIVDVSRIGKPDALRGELQEGVGLPSVHTEVKTSLHIGKRL